MEWEDAWLGRKCFFVWEQSVPCEELQKHLLSEGHRQCFHNLGGTLVSQWESVTISLETLRDWLRSKFEVPKTPNIRWRPFVAGSGCVGCRNKDRDRDWNRDRDMNGHNDSVKTR